MLVILLMVFAFVLFVFGFFAQASEPYRSVARLVCLGLAFWVAADAVTRYMALK
jgi:hypothetical protein